MAGYRFKMFTKALNADARGAAERFFGSLTSVGKFDEIEVRGVMGGVLHATVRESCFLAIYFRTVANVESLKLLNSDKHFQAISMIARNLFELAIDIVLIGKIPDAILKMTEYPDVEKLKCAKKIVAYKKLHPDIGIDDTIYQQFIANHAGRIARQHAALWPSSESPGKGRPIKHWSGMDLKKRADMLGSPFDRIYEVNQPQWSWQVHSGITGIANLKKETFTALAGGALNSCGDFYETILSAVIDEFQLHNLHGLIVFSSVEGVPNEESP